MKRTVIWAAVAVLAGAVLAPTVLAQVVADSACPKFAVDIADFATCDGDEVARPERAAAAPAAAAAVSDKERSSSTAARTAPAPVDVAQLPRSRHPRKEAATSLHKQVPVDNAPPQVGR